MPRTVPDTGITKYTTTAFYDLFIYVNWIELKLKGYVHFFLPHMHCKYVWYFLSSLCEEYKINLHEQSVHMVVTMNTAEFL
jgi:hypothetical protein